MTKKDIAKSISEKSGISQNQVLEIVQSVMRGIIDVLATEGRIELRNFGVFEVKRRKARLARNPRTGEPVPVPERMAVTFKPGREMAERVGRLTTVSSEE